MDTLTFAMTDELEAIHLALLATITTRDQSGTSVLIRNDKMTTESDHWNDITICIHNNLNENLCRC